MSETQSAPLHGDVSLGVDVEHEPTPIPESESGGRARARYASVRPHPIPPRQRPSDDVSGPSVIVEASVLCDGMAARREGLAGAPRRLGVGRERLAVAVVFVGLLTLGAIIALAMR